VNDRRACGEQVSARKQQESPRPQDAELREQEDGGDKIVDRERGLITRNERWNGSKRYTGERHGTCEENRRDADNGKGGRTIAT
jgi:hypothetical protein